MIHNALQNIRVVDFTRVLAGPFCTMQLGDFGAEVIKIEQPGRGDETREWGPPWAGTLSAYYLSVNRNKYSLTLNLKTPQGREIARQIALKSDVLVENFKVGGMREFGLDYATLQSHNPRLIYCSITGYGQTGPYAERPGYDYVIQGQSGLMSITGPPTAEPYKVGVAVSDLFTGLFAANAILTALHHREQSGQGQYIDVALLDSQIAALVNVASNYLISGQSPQRYGNAHANIVPYEAFLAHDGHFILAVGNDAQFAAACQVIGQPHWATDPRFKTNPQRVAHRAELIALLQPLFLEKPAADWVAAFLEAGVPAGPINTLPAALSDPQVREREMIQNITLADGTPVDLLGIVAKLSLTPGSIQRPPPHLGQDTTFILQRLLNLSDQQIAAYRQTGII